MNCNKLINFIDKNIPICPQDYLAKVKYIKQLIIDSVKFDFISTSLIHIKHEEEINFVNLPFDKMYCEIKESHGEIIAVVFEMIEGYLYGYYFNQNMTTGIEFNKVGQDFKVHKNGVTPLSQVGAEYVLNNVLIILKFIQLLNCSNITTETHQPSEKLNKKRLKRGKLPLFEYKTLVLPGTHVQAQEHQGGSHASPRWHVRRGHIRRLQNGNEIWVESCSVGSIKTGIINKDYRVELGGIE